MIRDEGHDFGKWSSRITLHSISLGEQAYVIREQTHILMSKQTVNPIHGLVALVLLLKRKVRYSQFASNCRVAMARMMGARVGDGVVIRPGVLLKGCNNISIGNGVFIGEGASVVAYDGCVTICDNVLIADYVYISSRNHRFSNFDQLIRDQGYRGESVVVEEDVWLAHGAVVLAGSVVPAKTVVGAMAVYSGKEAGAKIHRQMTSSEPFVSK